MNFKSDAPAWWQKLDERSRHGSMTADLRRRHSRHLLVPGVGPEGQARIRAARVLVVGLGGLGSPVLAYLAAAGVGTLGITDFDRVSLSNLQRQIIHGEGDVGRLKTASACDFIRRLDSGLGIEVLDGPFDVDHAAQWVERFDVVVDGTDNFPTRYLINDACHFAGIPWVHGSLFQFDGRVSVFGGFPGAPCYRCMHPEPPDPGTVPTCAEGGVLGPVPGIVGSLQACEVLKLICGTGEILSGRLLLIDAATSRFREIRLSRDPACALCGDDPTIHRLSVTGGCLPQSGSGDALLSPDQLSDWLTESHPPVVLDVRSAAEVQAVPALPGARHIPFETLPEHLASFDSSARYVIVCGGVERSRRAAGLLHDAGFGRVWVLAGGIEAWIDLVRDSSAAL